MSLLLTLCSKPSISKQSECLQFLADKKIIASKNELEKQKELLKELNETMKCGNVESSELSQYADIGIAKYVPRKKQKG